MTRAERIANLTGVVLPFVGVIAAIVLLWNRAVDLTDIGILVVSYLVTAIGVTVGFHRLLTHRAFATYPWLERTFAVMGSLSVQGSVMDWVADHRKHHAHTDVEGDPHSPHVGHGSGMAGLWHAHTGWLMETQGQADWRKYARDLYDDPAMRSIGRSFPLLAFVSLAAPTLAGWALHDFTLSGALQGLVWGGLVRIFLVHHVTWSVNSICHFFGTRRFEIEDRSTNVALAVAAVAGRVLAPQPPRVPAFGDARSAALGGRSVGLDHRRARARRSGVERDPHLARAPARQGDGRGPGLLTS